jgi:hypothetical protein
VSRGQSVLERVDETAFRPTPPRPFRRRQFTIRVRGQTMVTFTMDDLNGGEIRNCSLIPTDIPPAPNRYDGNFFQLNVVSWRVVS